MEHEDTGDTPAPADTSSPQHTQSPQDELRALSVRLRNNPASHAAHSLAAGLAYIGVRVWPWTPYAVIAGLVYGGG